MERRKPGRPSKGDRVNTSFRLPTHLMTALKERAAHQGMTVTDLVGKLVATEVGLPYMPQEGLPLDRAS